MLESIIIKFLIYVIKLNLSVIIRGVTENGRVGCVSMPERRANGPIATTDILESSTTNQLTNGFRSTARQEMMHGR